MKFMMVFQISSIGSEVTIDYNRAHLFSLHHVSSMDHSIVKFPSRAVSFILELTDPTDWASSCQDWS